jgi:DNA polymerase III subunit alpha
VISPRPLTELVPLHKTKNDEIVTAFDMVAIEKMGLLKMDFLGLTTLTILDDALKLIEQTRNRQDIRWHEIPLDDNKTYEKVFHKGLTSGVFQFESHGMRDVLRRYQPNSIDDLTALNALYRPGPIQGGMIDDFIDRKHGRKKVEYELPELKEILEETLGVIVYQEQVMQIANRWPATHWAKPICCAAPWARKKPRRWPAARALRGRRGAQRQSAEENRKDFRSHGQFAGYGFQQVALRGLRAAGLSHAYLKDALSRRVHGRAADFGHRQHRRRGEVHQRMPRNGHCRRTARHQRERRELHAAWRSHPLWPGGGEERRRQRHRIDRGWTQKTRPLIIRFTNSARTSICACSTSACWNR